jgi:DNA-binding NtrC family response regulator
VPSKPPCIAVFNSSDDIIDMLRMLIEQAGFAVVAGHVDDIRSGALDLRAFVEQHDPLVIVYDIAPPYDRSWRFLEHLRGRPPLAGRQFVITTTHVGHLREVVGRDEEVYEVVGKPLDLDQIVRAVKEASRARPTR